MANFERRHGERGAQLRLCVPADAKLGGYVRQEVIAFTEAQGIADDEVIDFVSAIGEALANAIEHAHTSEPIEVAAWMLDDRLFASVRDRGIGFTPSERTVTPALPDIYAERGRGLPIMRRCSDVLRVRSKPGEGTSVTLGCYVHRAAGWHTQNTG